MNRDRVNRLAIADLLEHSTVLSPQLNLVFVCLFVCFFVFGRVCRIFSSVLFA